MADTKSLTYADVAKHSSKKDIYVVIHDKVYNASSFVDEHPYAFPFQSLSFDSS
jgi:cytochrome b involved in lipid metabolism